MQAANVGLRFLQKKNFQKLHVNWSGNNCKRTREICLVLWNSTERFWHSSDEFVKSLFQNLRQGSSWRTYIRSSVTGPWTTEPFSRMFRERSNWGKQLSSRNVFLGWEECHVFIWDASFREFEIADFLSQPTNCSMEIFVFFKNSSDPVLNVSSTYFLSTPIISPLHC